VWPAQTETMSASTGAVIVGNALAGGTAAKFATGVHCRGLRSVRSKTASGVAAADAKSVREPAMRCSAPATATLTGMT